MIDVLLNHIGWAVVGSVLVAVVGAAAVFEVDLRIRGTR